MLSYFETNVNCPSCFNDIVAALTATNGVEDVEGHLSNGCLAVHHVLDEATLQAQITSVGRTIEVAGNGEYVMDQPHARARHTCDRRS